MSTHRLLVSHVTFDEILHILFKNKVDFAFKIKNSICEIYSLANYQCWFSLGLGHFS